MASLWTSVLLGAGIGGTYGAAAYAMNRLALRHERQRFLALCVGGMLLRMVGMLVAVGGTVALVPVHAMPFAAALLATLLVGLFLEVRMLYQRTVSA